MKFPNSYNLLRNQLPDEFDAITGSWVMDTLSDSDDDLILSELDSMTGNDLAGIAIDIRDLVYDMYADEYSDRVARERDYR